MVDFWLQAVVLLLLVFVSLFFLFSSLSSLLQVSIFDAYKKLLKQVVVLSRVVLAHDHFRQASEGKEMAVHDTLSLDSSNKVRVQVVNLQIGVFCLDNVPIQVIWLESLSCLWQTAQEVVQRLLILVASAKVVLEVRVDLLALLH